MQTVLALAVAKAAVRIEAQGHALGGVSLRALHP